MHGRAAASSRKGHRGRSSVIGLEPKTAFSQLSKNGKGSSRRGTALRTGSGKIAARTSSRRISALTRGESKGRAASLDYTDTTFYKDLTAYIDTVRLKLANQDQLRANWEYKTAEYAPKPLELEAIFLPPDIQHLVTVVAKADHQSWHDSKLTDGWVYGESTDNEKKVHRLLLPFDDLPTDAKESNLTSARENLKTILACGYSIEKDPQFVKKASYEVPDILSDLIDMIAFHLHETWSVGKVDQGYVYGPVRDDNLKHHPDLLPYYILTPDKRVWDQQSAEGGIKTVLKSGLLINKPDKMRVGDLLSADFKNKWAITPEALLKQREEDKRMRDAMQLMSETEAHKNLEIIDKTEQRQASTISVAEFADNESYFCFADIKAWCRGAFWDVYHPASAGLQRWNMLILIVLIYSCITVPVRLSFDRYPSQALEALVEILFLADVWVNMRIAYYTKKGELVVDRHSIFIFYLKGWFWLDILGSIPIELVEILGARPSNTLAALKMAKVIRVLKLWRMMKFIKIDVFREAKRKGYITPSALTLTNLILVFFLFLHLLACGYWAVAKSVGFSDEPDRAWVPNTFYEDSQTSFSEQYVFALHYSLLACVGSNTAPTEFEEILFQCVATILGIMIMSAIIGSATSVLSHMNAEAEEQKMHMDRIMSYMRKQHVPDELQVSIYTYYEFLFTHNWTFNREELFPNLPKVLDLQLQLALKQHLIKKCAMFSDCQPQTVMAIVQKLTSSVAIPGEVIFRKGDTGNQMYFLVFGKTVPYAMKGKAIELHTHIEEGQTFGELAFFEVSNLHRMSMKSVEYSELERLRFKDLAHLMELYPEVAIQVQASAQSHARGHDVSKEEGFQYVWTQQTEADPEDVPVVTGKLAGLIGPVVEESPNESAEPASPKVKKKLVRQLTKKVLTIATKSKTEDKEAEQFKAVMAAATVNVGEHSDNNKEASNIMT